MRRSYSSAQVSRVNIVDTSASRTTVRWLTVFSVTTENTSMPVAFSLSLPEVWARDKRKPAKVGVPDAVSFQPKAADRSRTVRKSAQKGFPGTELCSPMRVTKNDSQFRPQLGGLGSTYIVGVQSGVPVRKTGERPKAALKRKASGRPPELLWSDSKTTCSNQGTRPAQRYLLTMQVKNART